MKNVILEKEYEKISQLVKKQPQTRNDEEVAAIVNFLHRLDFFKEMAYELLIPLAEQLKVFEIEPKAVICKEGEIGTIFYVLIKGKIKVYKKAIQISTMQKPGIGFGELALQSDNMKRQATLVAETHTTLIALTKEDYNIYL